MKSWALQQRLCERIRDKRVDVPVPHIVKEILEGIMGVHQKRISDCTEKRIVDVSWPYVVKEILEDIMDTRHDLSVWHGLKEVRDGS